MTIIKMSEINESIIRTIDPTIELADNAMLRHRPDLFDQWDFEKNDLIGLDVYKAVKGNNSKVGWKCNKGHEWQARIASRVGKPSQNGTNCPYCSGNFVCIENCIATLRPDIAEDWHPTLNGDTTTFDVMPSSGKVAWWKCSNSSCGSEYSLRIADKTMGRKCSYCSLRKVSKNNSLKALYPNIAKKWHPTKNENLTIDEVTGISSKSVWWMCDKEECGESFKSPVRNLTKLGLGCPICSNQRLGKYNSLAVKNPDLSKLWHPTENNEVTLMMLFVEGLKTLVAWECRQSGQDQ
jgi:DNA-directed RNA polymerase subunit RPC12/RpoP